MDCLIVELSNKRIGSSDDGTIINNISYADNIVLLSPLISAHHKLVVTCELYAETYDLSTRRPRMSGLRSKQVANAITATQKSS